MTRVGIILIATGRYISFFEPVYQSYEKYFLPKYKKNYFLFTDSDKSFHSNVGSFISDYQKMLADICILS